MKTIFRLLLLPALVFATAASQAYETFAPGTLPDPVTDADFYADGQPPAAQVELGRLLFFDKILSGNQNVSCATCHHPELATTDGVALGLGEGAHGLGPDRRTGPAIPNAVHARVPRNAPALFNLGAEEFTRMYHDGRVEADPQGFYEGGFITPARWKLPDGLDNVLAAQAMFPVTSPAEMAGQQGENAIADARALNNVAGPGGVWELLARRLQAIPAYVDHFRAAFPDHVEHAEDITMVLAANAIAAFEATAFRADGSPFDRFLRTGEALPPAAERGLRLFYGPARCASCHGGAFQTDHEFHAIAMPQIGPGKGDGGLLAGHGAPGLPGRFRAGPRDRPHGGHLPIPHPLVAQCGPHRPVGARRSLHDARRRRPAPPGPGAGPRRLRRRCRAASAGPRG